MKLCSQSEVQSIGVRTVYRRPWTVPVLLVGGCLVFAVGWALFLMGRTEAVIAWLPAVAALVLAGIGVTMTFAALSPSNWLLIDSAAGLYIHIRSHMNWRLHAAYPTVIHLAPGDVVTIRGVRQRLELPNREVGTTVTVTKYLEIRVRPELFARIAEAVRRERNEAAAASKRDDYPVRAVPPDAVRIEWTARQGLERALVQLEHTYERESMVYIEPERWDLLPRAGQDALVTELWERGQVDTAARLVQQRETCSAEEAKHYMAELVERERGMS